MSGQCPTPAGPDQAPHACCLAAPVGQSGGFRSVKTAIMLGTLSPSARAGPALHRCVGLQASPQMQRVWRPAWGEGTGLKLMSLGPPPSHQGRVWGSRF